MRTVMKQRNSGGQVSVITDPPVPPQPVPPDPEPEPPIPPLPAPDPKPEPDRAAELLRLAELPRAVVAESLADAGSATPVGGFVRFTRPRAATPRHGARRLARAMGGS